MKHWKPSWNNVRARDEAFSVLPGIEIGLDSSDSNTFINRLVESGKLDLANDLVV